MFELQQFLNGNPQTRVAISGPGAPGQETAYFGILTRQAVVRFQSMLQYGIYERDGVVRGATRTTMNQLTQNQAPTAAATDAYGFGNYGIGGYGIGSVGQGIESPSWMQQRPVEIPRVAQPNINLGSINPPSSPAITQPSPFSGALLAHVSVLPKTVGASEPVTLSFSGLNNRLSYRLRIDCVPGVHASNQYSQELCRSTNALKSSNSPYAIRFTNATGGEQVANLVVSAHDEQGAIVDVRVEEVRIRPVSVAVAPILVATTTAGMTAPLPDLLIAYAGPTSVTRGQMVTPSFTVREANAVPLPPTSVRTTLYDLFFLSQAPSLYGYEPVSFADQNHVLATNQVTVSTGYSSNTLFPASSYTLYQSGVYKVCASVDTTNVLIETAKLNNITCGYVTVL